MLSNQQSINNIESDCQGNYLYKLFVMGCSQSNSSVVDHEGKVVLNRRCIVLICPPSFQTTKFIDNKPQNFTYRFISVGKLIRDQINKRTHYSKIIMQNLAKYKKINDKILQVLLKNVALQGNFIIQFCPKDSEDIQIWSKFLKQVQVQQVVIIKPDQKMQANQQKILYQQKIKSYQNDIKSIKSLFGQGQGSKIKYYTNGPDLGRIWQQIIEKISKSSKKQPVS